MEVVEVHLLQEINITNSAGTCNPIVRDVMHDHKLFDNEETVEFIHELKEEKDLKLGEIILLYLVYIRCHPCQAPIKELYSREMIINCLKI